MFNSFFAQLGNLAISFFAWFVKFNPMWAYHFTHFKNNHAEKFLLGKDKELQLIKKLYHNGVSETEIRAHVWSEETRLAILSTHNMATIFVDHIWNSKQFNAAMRSQSASINLRACSQRKYTPSEEQVLNIANMIYPDSASNAFRPGYVDCLKALIKYHNHALTAKVLNKFDNRCRAKFVELAIEIDKASEEQVEWAFTSPWGKEFIKHFFLKIPKDAANANNLWEFSEELFIQWVHQQDAKTLCSCCLSRWAKENNVQYLHLIEKKALANNDSDSVIQLVKSTRKQTFQYALEYIIRQNVATAHLLNFVDKDNIIYPTLVQQVLNQRSQIKYLSKKQIEGLSDSERNLYWKNMALYGFLTAEAYAQLPEGEHKNKIAQIMEENAMIEWFKHHNTINDSDLQEFGDRTLSNRVQLWLAKNRLTWLVLYFSGPAIDQASKIAFKCNWPYKSSRKPMYMSIDAFKHLVNTENTNVLYAYLYVFKSIPQDQREYLLCSPLKHLAVGIGTAH